MMDLFLHYIGGSKVGLGNTCSGVLYGNMKTWKHHVFT